MPSALSAPQWGAWHAAQRAAIAPFLAQPDINLLMRRLTEAADTALRALLTEDSPYALLAVGGYGRCALLPESDIDLLVIAPHDMTSEQAMGWLSPLWQSGRKVGLSVHTPESAVQAAMSEHTIAASFLDARLIAGNKKLAASFTRRFWAAVKRAEPSLFIEAKLKERDRRHERFGDSRFILEPHIKEGKGGLRDVQTLRWMVQYAYANPRLKHRATEALLAAEDWVMLRESEQYFLTVRALLHALHGRAEERLSFEWQPKLAVMLGHAGSTAEARAQALMAQYFAWGRQVGSLTRSVLTALEAQGKRHPTHSEVSDAQLALPDGVVLQAGRLALRHARVLQAQPEMALRLFALAHMYGRELHPSFLQQMHAEKPKLQRLLPRSAKAAEVFLDILLGPAPDSILRRMNEAGVLCLMIPEFVQVVGQMQYDGYHTYTVDEHILIAIGNLHAIETGAWLDDAPVTTQAAKEIVHRRAAYIALLCHDIAKGAGGHAERGREIAAQIAQRLGCTAHEVALVSWLVAHHQLLSDIAFKRDLEDSRVIAQLAAQVQSPERMRLLLMLTLADMRAVGPRIWNAWKAAMLRRLYERTMQAMGVALTLAPLRDDSEVDAALLARAAEQSPPQAYQYTILTAQAVTRLQLILPYHRGLFRDVAGVMAWVGASILSARTRMLSGGLVALTLQVQTIDGSAFDRIATLESIPELLQRAQDGQLPFARELPKRAVKRTAETELSVATDIYFDQTASTEATIIEVNARDRAGLLFDILSRMHEEGLQVTGAHIATYGQKAVDVFYVKDRYGMKLIHPTRQRAVRDALLTMLDPNLLTYHI